MELSRALRLGANPCLALVGAGGKSSALFKLAAELHPPLILTASTHLSLAQVEAFEVVFAGRHHIARSADQLRSLRGAFKQGHHLLTGPVVGDRTKGLSQEALAWLDHFCREQKIPLLIEADGSRLCPVKAPAVHEPAIPHFARQVVVVQGLSALGKPLNADWVHRPEIFAQRCRCRIGEPITTQALSRVLIHPSAGLKNIPNQARRMVLLNQADNNHRAAAQTMVKPLLDHYDSVVVASLQHWQNPTTLQGSSLSQNGDTLSDVFGAYEAVAGIVLAGGESKRFGKPKQLLAWKGKPFVWRAAKTALKAGLHPVLVVTGAYPEAVEKAVGNLPVQVVPNPVWRQGQGTSVNAGVKALPPSSGAVVFLLADQPQIPPKLILRLVDAHTRTLALVVAPWVGQQRANPVLFDRDLFPDLSRLEGEAGGRQIFSRADVHKVPWDDPAILLDVDTPEDYVRLQRLNG